MGNLTGVLKYKDFRGDLPREGDGQVSGRGII